MKSQLGMLREEDSKSEIRRLMVIESTGLWETLPEDRYDRLTRLAANLCDAPMSYISLVGESEVWVKSAFGFDVNRWPRYGSPCHDTIKHQSLHVITDLLADSRYHAHPTSIGEKRLSYYVGIPLIMTDGTTIGTLSVQCLPSTAPDPKKLQSLQDIARIVQQEISSDLEFNAESGALSVEATIELTRRNLVLEVVNEIALSDPNDLTELLQRMVKGICEAIDGTSAYISRLSDDYVFETVVAEYFAESANQKERLSDLGATYQVG
ncbi:MAG: GAF domain-containing protein, partial [Chloroflexota bacterium]